MIVAAATIARPPSDTARTALRSPGRTRSATRTAIASRTASANGAIVVRSAQVIGRDPRSSGARAFHRNGHAGAARRGLRRPEAQEPDHDDGDDDPDPERHDGGVDRDRVSVADRGHRVGDRPPEEVEQEAWEEPE